LAEGNWLLLDGQPDQALQPWAANVGRTTTGNLMRNKTVGFDVVREIASALPDVEESTIHGAPSLKVRGRLLTCPALHMSAAPNTLAVRIGFDQRAELMAAEPRVYYVTDHYVNYPTVLVRLSEIDRDSLRDLLGMAWIFVTSKNKRGGPGGSKRARSRTTAG
jgi:hypothetical protein